MCFFLFFFFNDTATTEIYTLSLHDALPISRQRKRSQGQEAAGPDQGGIEGGVGVLARAHRQPPTRHQLIKQPATGDRKSTRLNSSHGYISYAVFCLKKKKKKQNNARNHKPA